jgi:hypothetical protein
MPRPYYPWLKKRLCGCGALAFVSDAKLKIKIAKRECGWAMIVPFRESIEQPVR